jgi:hypothetical protein
MNCLYIKPFITKSKLFNECGVFHPRPYKRVADKSTPSISGAPRAGARGTSGAAEPAEAPVLLSILRSPATCGTEDGRQGFGGHPHSRTAGGPWLPAKAGERASSWGFAYSRTRQSLGVAPAKPRVYPD